MIKSIKTIIYLVVALAVSGVKAGSYEDFFQAVNRDDGRTVSALIKRGFDPNSRDPQGQTALHLALRDESPSTAEAVWASPELDVNAHNSSGETPLMLAALRGNLSWAERLLARGAKVHQDGWSPLHYAATGPEAKLVAMLLDRGAPINATSPNRSTPLMMAARYGSENSVDLLLARGADRSRINDLNQSAVDFARMGERPFLEPRLTARKP